MDWFALLVGAVCLIGSAAGSVLGQWHLNKRWCDLHLLHHGQCERKGDRR